jgi:hypothetical protein
MRYWNFEEMSEEKKVYELPKVFETPKMSEMMKVAEEKKTVDPFIAGFFESMAKTNTEKITKEITTDLSEDSDDSD